MIITQKQNKKKDTVQRTMCTVVTRGALMRVARIHSEKIKMFVHLLHRHIVKGAGGAVPPKTETLPTQCDFNLARVPGAFKTIFRYQEVSEQLFNCQGR